MAYWHTQALVASVGYWCSGLAQAESLQTIQIGCEYCTVKSSLNIKSINQYINNRQPYGSLSNVLRRPAVVEGSLQVFISRHITRSR